MANIFEAINGAMADVGAIGKNSKNQQQGFMYRGVDTVMNTLQPVLVKHGIFVAPEVLEQTREERTTSKGNSLIYSVCKMRYTFYATDGSNISAVVVGEGMDSGDKSTNKAMSVAFKYAMFQVFCIPTEEMVDPDAECHEVKPKKAGHALTPDQLATLSSEMLRTGVTTEQICNRYNVPDLLALSNAQYENCLKGLNQTKAKAS